MSFIQIVSFRTSRIDEFAKLEQEWLDATEGRRTLLRDALYTDRDNPGCYVTINEFRDYESAMVNSTLPETSELAARAVELCDEGPMYTNLELVRANDELVERLRTFLETNEVPPGLFTEDVVTDMNVPLWRFQLRGARSVAAQLEQDGPHQRVFEEHDVTHTPDGFLVQFAWRTKPGPGYDSHYSRGVYIATVTGGLISRITVHCSGDWTPDDEQRQRDEAPMVS